MDMINKTRDINLLRTRLGIGIRGRKSFKGVPSRFCRLTYAKAPMVFILYVLFIVSVLSTVVLYLVLDETKENGVKKPLAGYGHRRLRALANFKDVFDISAADLFAVKPMKPTDVALDEENAEHGESNTARRAIEVCPEFEIPHLVGVNTSLDLNDDVSLQKVEEILLESRLERVNVLVNKTNDMLSKLDLTNPKDYSTSCMNIRRTRTCLKVLPESITMASGVPVTSNYTLMPGGHWKPNDCIPRWKVAVVIPFRNRSFHLPILLQYLTPFMQRQRLEFGFYVVEQANNLLFNRAMLMNVGFLEALNFTKWDCFIFHDVDHIPLDDSNYYGCSGMPRHFMSGADRWHYKLPYNTFFGAVTGFSRGQIFQMNGFPNVYWGWGGEDDEIFERTKSKGLTVSRADKVVGRYNVIKHHHSSAPLAKDRFTLLKQSKPRMAKDGLTNLRYAKPNIKLTALYTNISVDIQKLPVTWSSPKIQPKRNENTSASAPRNVKSRDMKQKPSGNADVKAKIIVAVNKTAGAHAKMKAVLSARRDKQDTFM